MEKFKDIIDRLDKELTKSRNDEYRYSDYCVASIQTGNYTISVWCGHKSNEVEIYNHSHDERCYPNLEEWLSKRVVPYNDIEVEPILDIWQENGFANEADYYNWRYR